MRHPNLEQELQRRGARLESCAVTRVKDFGDAAREAQAAFDHGAVHDQSFAARLAVRGRDRVDFVNRLCTNDVTRTSDRTALTAAMTNAKGRVLDHVSIYQRSDAVVLSGSESQGTSLKQWLEKFIVMEDCVVNDLAAEEFRLLVFGRSVPDVLVSVLGLWPATAGDGSWPVARSRFQDGDVFVVCVPAPFGNGALLQGPHEISGRLFATLADAGLRPVGSEAFEQVRVESGLPALPREIGDHSNPLEAGLRRSVSFQKGCYIGQEVVARLENYHKVRRALSCLAFPIEAEPSELGEVFVELLRIGEISSAVRSPRLNATVALAFLNPQYAAPGTRVYSIVRGEQIHGDVREFPVVR